MLLTLEISAEGMEKMPDEKKKVLETTETGELQFTAYGEFLSYFHAHIDLFKKFLKSKGKPQDQIDSTIKTVKSFMTANVKKVDHFFDQMGEFANRLETTEQELSQYLSANFLETLPKIQAKLRDQEMAKGNEEEAPRVARTYTSLLQEIVEGIPFTMPKSNKFRQDGILLVMENTKTGAVIQPQGLMSESLKAAKASIEAQSIAKAKVAEDIENSAIALPDAPIPKEAPPPVKKPAIVALPQEKSILQEVVESVPLKGKKLNIKIGPDFDEPEDSVATEPVPKPKAASPTPLPLPVSQESDGDFSFDDFAVSEPASPPANPEDDFGNFDTPESAPIATADEDIFAGLVGEETPVTSPDTDDMFSDFSSESTPVSDPENDPFSGLTSETESQSDSMDSDPFSESPSEEDPFANLGEPSYTPSEATEEEDPFASSETEEPIPRSVPVRIDSENQLSWIDYLRLVKELREGEAPKGRGLLSGLYRELQNEAMGESPNWSDLTSNWAERFQLEEVEVNEMLSLFRYYEKVRTQLESVLGDWKNEDSSFQSLVRYAWPHVLFAFRNQPNWEMVESDLAPIFTRIKNPDSQSKFSERLTSALKNCQ